MNKIWRIAPILALCLELSGCGQKSADSDFSPLAGVNYVSGAEPQIVLNNRGGSWTLLAGRQQISNAEGLTVESSALAPEAHMTVTQGATKINLLPRSFQLSQGLAGGFRCGECNLPYQQWKVIAVR